MESAANRAVWIVATTVSVEHRSLPAAASMDAAPLAMATKNVNAGGEHYFRYSSSSTMNHKNPDIINDLWYCEDNGLLHDAWGRNLEEQVKLEILGDFEHGMIHGRAKSHRNRRERERQLCGPFEIPKPRDGEILLGTNRRGEQLRLPISTFSRPTLFCSETGGGKTNATKAIALQLCQHLKGAFFFDTVKNEMRGLQAPLKRVGIDCLVLTGQLIRLNVLQLTPGIPLEPQVAARATLLADIFQLPQRSRKLFTSVLYQLYQQQPNPTLYDVYLCVRQKKDANAQAKMAILDGLEPVLRSTKCLRYRRGWTIQDLIERFIVFELHDLPETGKLLVLSILMLWTFEYGLAQGASNCQLQTILFVDEALPLLMNPQNPIVRYIGLTRGIGCSVWLNAQTAIPLDQIILANIPNRWLGPTSSYRDIETMGSSMGLIAEQKRWLTRLPIGQFLAKLSGVPSPMLIDVPLLRKLPQTATTGIGDLANIAVEEINVSLDSSGENLDDVEWRPQAGEVTNLAMTENSQQSPSAAKLTADEMTFLQAVIAVPCKPVSFYPDQLQFSKRKATDTRRSLVELGLLQEQKAQISRRGRPSILLAPTKQGTQIAKGT